MFYMRCICVSPHASAGALLIQEKLPTLGASGPQRVI